MGNPGTQADDAIRRLLFRFVGIFEGHCPVKYGVIRCGILVQYIVSGALELNGNARFVFEQCRLCKSLSERKRFRVEEVLVVLVLRYLAHIGKGKELVVIAQFQGFGVSGRYPMDGTLYRTPLAASRPG